MKVIFLRHGESEDDIKHQFGGWSDPKPTKKGLKLAKIIANEFKVKYPEINIFYSSPLLRAFLFAKEIGKFLKIYPKELVYLKERNTYGLLNGLNINYAKKRYPEIYEKFQAQEFIPGSERYDDFIERVKMLIKFLSSNYNPGITLCVTQGYLMTTIIEEFIGLIRGEIGNGSYILTEINKEKIRLLESDRITFLNNEIFKTKKFKKVRNN